MPVLILEFVLHLTLYSFYVHNNSVHQGYGQSRSSLLLNCYFSYYSVELRDLVKKKHRLQKWENLQEFLFENTSYRNSSIQQRSQDCIKVEGFIIYLFLICFSVTLSQLIENYHLMKC